MSCGLRGAGQRSGSSCSSLSKPLLGEISLIVHWGTEVNEAPITRVIVECIIPSEAGFTDWVSSIIELRENKIIIISDAKSGHSSVHIDFKSIQSFYVPIVAPHQIPWAMITVTDKKNNRIEFRVKGLLSQVQELDEKIQSLTSR